MNTINYEKYFDNISYLEDWINEAPGWFTVSDITSDRAEQLTFTRKFETLVSIGKCQRHPDRRGCYRKIESELEVMDFVNIEANPVDIWLPFGLSDYVSLFSGNMVLLAGAKSCGKTAVMLNIIHENMREWDVEYFNSEMGAAELRHRLDLFPYTSIKQWDFTAYRRASNFGEAIVGGTEKLILIDFLEIHDEFYAVGKAIKAIHDNLKGAIAIVALQKNPGSDVGLGGWRSAEVSRLYLSIDRSRVKITDAKNFRQPDKNPNGWVRNFNIKNGCQITTPDGWKREVKGE